MGCVRESIWGETLFETLSKRENARNFQQPKNFWAFDLSFGFSRTTFLVGHTAMEGEAVQQKEENPKLS